MDGVDDVCAGLGRNNQQDAGLAIDVAGGADVFDGVLDVGKIGDLYGSAVVITDDERLVILGLEKLIVSDDVSGSVFVRYLPLRHVCVLLAEQGRNILQPKAVAV